MGVQNATRRLSYYVINNIGTPFATISRHLTHPLHLSSHEFIRAMGRGTLVAGGVWAVDEIINLIRGTDSNETSMSECD